MITIEESIPSKNNNYIIAEEIFYVQFNEISFFIEDEAQENFFFCILKNLFPDIKIEKIFPLCGKDNVIKESNANLDDKTKVFIVDKDFDDLFNRVVSNNNLFYLERYSIENHLIEKKAIVDYIIGEKPKLKRKDVNTEFNIQAKMNHIQKKIDELIHLHLLVQNKCPRLKNVSMSYERFFDFNNGDFCLKQEQLENYKLEISNELKEIDGRLTIDAQFKNIKDLINIKNNILFIKHAPGKYIIKMLKQIIESMFGLVSRNVESFCYRIAENCSFDSLNGLKIEVEAFLK